MGEFAQEHPVAAGLLIVGAAVGLLYFSGSIGVISAGIAGFKGVTAITSAVATGLSILFME